MKETESLRLITRIEDLPPKLAQSISEDERRFIASLSDKGLLPFAATPFYASLAEGQADDPIRKQCIPDPREGYRSPVESDDPLGEAFFPGGSRFVHQYHDRILLLANGSCAGYCRHCFRRVWTGEARGFIGQKDQDSLCTYLLHHEEVREILISGGDPLMAADGPLERLFIRLREARSDILLRLGSRVPVTYPARIDRAFIELLKTFKPIRMVVHINHPRELADQVQAVLVALVEAGIPVHSQTVLLKGINDHEQTLAQLFRDLTNLGVTPYYLFQGDLATGTAHLRLPLREGLRIYEKLSTLISGLCLPTYAVDLPGGGGKLSLHRGVILGEEKDAQGIPYHLLRGRDGGIWRYPVE